MTPLPYRALLTGVPQPYGSKPVQTFHPSSPSALAWAKDIVDALGDADKKTAVVKVYRTAEELVVTYMLPIEPVVMSVVTPAYKCVVCGLLNCTNHDQRRPNLGPG